MTPIKGFVDDSYAGYESYYKKYHGFQLQILRFVDHAPEGLFSVSIVEEDEPCGEIFIGAFKPVAWIERLDAVLSDSE